MIAIDTGFEGILRKQENAFAHRMDQIFIANFFISLLLGEFTVSETN